jgi:hypothetical protein
MKKLIAALTTAIFAVALVVVGAAAPASAHTPTLAGVSTCDSSTGTWSVTWTFATANVPNGVEASSKVTSYSPTASTLSSTKGVGTGTNLTFSTFSKNPQAGVTTRTGNWTVTFTQTGIATSNTKATVSVHTDWSDKVSGNASATENFSGPCGAPTAPPTPPSTPKDALASVSTTASTCAVGETLVLGTLVNAAWQGQPVYSGSGYTVVAVAQTGHKFADGPTVTDNNSTETFTGTLAGKLSSTSPTCVTTTPPVCIPASAVHYTYSPTENGGIIYVDNVPNSTNKLCAAFYVTATSWKYTQSNNTWPQQLDIVNDYYIAGPGVFPYSASVHCGQGDIYAASAAAGQPTPPQQLNGPSNPWHEHFLHDMGFKGDSPTFTNSALSCFTSVPVTGTPKASIATCAAPSGNGLTLPAIAGGVWTVTSGSHTMTLPIGTGKNVGTVYGFGAYTITLGDGDPHDAYRVTASHASWTPVDISKIDCNTTVTPIVPTATPVAGCGTTGSIHIPANSAEVKYTLRGDGHTGTNVVTATAQGATEFAGNPPTQTASWTFELGQPTQCIGLTPGTPTVSAQTCVAGNLVGGAITVENQVGLIFTIKGGPSTLDITPAVGTTTNLLAGTYTVTVTVDNSNPNYVLTPNSTTSFTLVVAAAVDCRTVSVTASSTDALCSSTPAGATPLTYVPGTITITQDADVTYTISDGTTTTPVTSSITNVNAGTYTVTAQLTMSAQNAGAVLPVSSWGPFVIAPVNCTVATAPVGDPTASSCFNLTSDTTLLSWVHAEAADHVSYQIFPAGNPSAATALAVGYTSELPGNYTVVATADNGYTLDIAGDTSSVTTQWNLTVADTSDCLPTGAAWHAGASADPAVCVSSTSQLGTIHLTHLASEIGQVDYTITNSTTNAVIDAGSTATSVQVGPGTYVVTAVAVTPGDGISTDSTFNLVIDAAAAACGTLSTLAFTGVSASVGILGLLLAGGMLFLGLAAVFIRLASRRSAI